MLGLLFLEINIDMKYRLLLLLLAVSCHFAIGQKVDENHAKKVAKNFVKQEFTDGFYKEPKIKKTITKMYNVN